MKKIFLLLVMFCSTFVFSQQKQSISGQVIAEKNKLIEVDVILVGTKLKTQTDSLGNYKFDSLAVGNYKIQITALGFETARKSIILKESEDLIVNLDRKSNV